MSDDQEVPLRLKIDRLNLHEEWEGQAVQYYHWAKKSADAQFRLDGVKSALALKEAELDREIRNDPTGFDIGKLTDKVVAQTISVQPEYKAAESEVRKAYHELLHYKAAVDALDHRKRALTMMVELFTREYYADSHYKGVSRDMSDAEKQDVRARGQRRMQQQEQREEDHEV